MNVLVLNCGSSTVKFQIIETDREAIAADSDRQLVKGLIERIGGQALLTFETEGQGKERHAEPLRDHRAAIDRILRWIVSPASKIEQIQALGDIHAVGHRVVHGGEHFRKSVRIDADVLEGIEDCIELAPLHNPANLKGIRAATELLGGGVPQVAVFDTSFHSTMPDVSYLYGIPYQLYRRHKIRRYGFHGTSHRYIAYRYRSLVGVEADHVHIITLHLGNGCSACAIKGGRSFNTSMGFTPLEGLVMGTRSGDLDPSLVEYLSVKEGMSVSEIDTLFNKQSGLLGVSGLTSDMRELLEEEAENQDRRARLAIEIFCRRVRHYIGGYLAELGGADAVVFAGGIGQNAPRVRERVCQGLDALGLVLDGERNSVMVDGAEGEITAVDATLKAYVIPTNEELLIARDTYRVLEDLPRRW
ncbi:MAG: acetate kinase [Gemmatimonadales bacterium]|jgi:acetate kinase